MRWSTVSRITKLGLINFWRNLWLSLASTLVMTLTLLVISLFVIMTIVIGKTTDRIKSKMDISVYFKESATSEEISNLQQQLAARSDVKEVRFISKEEAVPIFQAQQKNQRLKELLNELTKGGENPLPRSLAIKAIDPANLNSIADFLDADDIQAVIHKVSYEENKLIIDKLLAMMAFVKKIGWIASAIFIIVSILVLLNTIRLAIFSRKEEIEIMRLVGANNRFIKIPFVVEGTLYGFLACLLATGIMWIGILSVSPLTNQYLGIGVTLSIKEFFISHLAIIFFLQLAVGTFIGICCSLFSIRKYLRI